MDPADSPALGRFLDHVDVVLSVHGYGRDGLFTTLLLGGGDRALAGHVAGHLRAAPARLHGRGRPRRHPPAAAGPAPRQPGEPDSAGGGVQIELPPRIRLQGPNADPAARQALVDGLGAAAALTARGG